MPRILDFIACFPPFPSKPLKLLSPIDTYTNRTPEQFSSEIFFGTGSNSN